MKKILVVDDEENIRLLYKEELEEEGFLVELAGSGEEALEKLSHNYTQTAKALGISLSTLKRKVLEYGLERPG